MLTDTLTNCCRDLTKSLIGLRYGRGILVGVVGALMHQGHSFPKCLEIIKENLPSPGGPHGDFDDRCFPDSWKADWQRLMQAQTVEVKPTGGGPWSHFTED